MATTEEVDTADGRVQFAEESVAEAKSKRRLELTQRYDRREVQKRLDIESWMDQQMKSLYECEDYPELDLDDVLSVPQAMRQERLKEYLKDAKKPPEGFIDELLKRTATIKQMY